MKTKPIIFILDDDDIFLEMIKDEIGGNEKYQLNYYKNSNDCINDFLLNPIIIVLDHFLNSKNPYAINGLEVLKEIQKHLPKTEVIVLSGQIMPDVTFEYVWKSDINYYITKDDQALKKLKTTINNIIDSKIY